MCAAWWFTCKCANTLLSFQWNTWAATGSLWVCGVLFGEQWVDSRNTPLYLYNGLHDVNEGFFFPECSLMSLRVLTGVQKRKTSLLMLTGSATLKFKETEWEGDVTLQVRHSSAVRTRWEQHVNNKMLEWLMWVFIRLLNLSHVKALHSNFWCRIRTITAAGCLTYCVILRESAAVWSQTDRRDSVSG